MTVGAYRPLDDCLRIAFTELVHWIHNDYGLSELDTYELLSKVARIPNSGRPLVSQKFGQPRQSHPRLVTA